MRDVQNLVTLSRLPILQTRQLRHELAPPPRYRPVMADPPVAEAVPIEWERPLSCTRVDIGGGRGIEIVNVHLRAPLAAFLPGQKESAFAWRSIGGRAEGFAIAAMKRNGQALEARLLIDQLFDEADDPLIAVCRDFNAADREVPVAIIRGDVEDTGNPRLGGRIMVPLEKALPAPARFTVRHGGREVMMDHILVSRPLLGLFRAIEVHNELLADELVAFATERKDPESFHAPVVATFALPD